MTISLRRQDVSSEVEEVAGVVEIVVLVAAVVEVVVAVAVAPGVKPVSV